MTTTTVTPRIYVASLSDYNAGILHGAWIDADQDSDDIHAAIQVMLAESPNTKRYPQDGPAEEWAIHDYEGFNGYRLSEYAQMSKVAALAHIMENAPSYAGSLLDEYCEGWEDDPEGTAERLTDACRGEIGYEEHQHNSVEDWAEEYARDLYPEIFETIDGNCLPFIFNASDYWQHTCTDHVEVDNYIIDTSMLCG